MESQFRQLYAGTVNGIPLARALSSNQQLWNCRSPGKNDDDIDGDNDIWATVPRQGKKVRILSKTR
jgi:hypothetical protein